MIYGDQRTITDAHNLALRHLVASVSSVLEFDAANADANLAEALMAIETAEKAAANTGDPEPTDAGPDHCAGIFPKEE
jgi:hypothetical protein